METLFGLVIAGLVLYAAWLNLQLYISRRIISALQETTVTAEAGRPFPLKPALAGLGLLILAAGFLINQLP